MANLPTEVQQEAGNLNDGLEYERKLLLFIAASLSQDKQVRDFAIVSNPKGIDKIDDVVVKISFLDCEKEDIALFIQSKLTSPKKLLWLSLNNKKPAQKCYEIKLKEYQTAFNDVTTLLNSNISETKNLRELLKGVDVKNYYVCIFTNMEKVHPQLQCKEFDKDHPIYFLGTQNRGQYQHFDYENDAKFNTNFYKQLYVFLGQPNYTDMDNTIAHVLGEDSKKMPYLDKVIKDFMQRDLFCGVLTKQEFEFKLCEVVVTYWMIEDKKVDIIIEKHIELWNKILSEEEIINLCDNKIAALLAYHCQCVIRKEVDEYFDWKEGVTKLTQTTKDCIQQKYNKNVTDLNDLLFLLWRDNKIPLAIKSEYTPNILSFLQKFKTLKRKFVIFCSKNSPELKEYTSTESVITYVREITDNKTLENIFDLEVSLEGRRPVALKKISAVPIETAVEGIYKELAISQVLAWTEKSENIQHIIGPQLHAPDDKYIIRYFTPKEKEQIKFTQEAVLELVGPGLHIIIGEPGMGKSKVLEALAHCYSPKTFVIYIKLRDCLDDIENPDTLKKIKRDPIQYFFNKMTKNTNDKITISIMEAHKTSKRLCLFLDGFDEILPHHGRQILSLIETILEGNHIRIFCTTRPHGEEKIISRDGTICFKLLPFDYEQVIQYTKSKINEEDLQRFDFKFLSNPQHLYMILQIYEDTKNLDGVSRGEMYKRFIEEKHEIKYNDKLKWSKHDAYSSIRNSLNNHRILAMVDIFGKECVTSQGLISALNNEVDYIVTDIGVQNVGIVDVRNLNKSFQFVHRTFAEYFVAEWLLHNMVQNDSNTKYLKYFHKEIWYEDSYSDIKKMIIELTRNYDLWLEAIKYFFVNSSGCSCDGYSGWLQCTVSHPNVNCSTIADSINMDYPTRTPLTADDVDSCTLLLTAIQAENVVDVESNLSQSLLDTGVGMVAFILAIATGNEGIVELLLEHRPTLVDDQDANGNTGLHLSCAFGYSSITALLFEKRANFVIRNHKHKTPLAMATENKQWGIWMMKQIGEISKSSGGHGHVTSTKYQNINNDLSEALLISSSNFKWDIVKQLLEHGAEPTLSNDDGWTSMHFAARGRDLQVVDLLLKRGLDLNKKTNNGKTPLAIAFDHGNTDIAKWLLEQNADPILSDENGWTSMHFAAESGRLDMVKILLERGLNLNEQTNDGRTPLSIAFGLRKWNIVKWLLEHHADPTLSDEDGWTLMHFAAGEGQFAIVKILLERGLNVNEQTHDGKTPFTIAFDLRNWNLVQILLEHGADLTLSDENGWALLHFAAEEGQFDIVKILLEKGLNVNEQTHDGKTPFTIAFGLRNWSLVQILLEHGADLTLSDENGSTLLHFAAEEGQFDIVKILLERGLNVNEQTNDYKTPLTIAFGLRNWNIVQLLLEHGADLTISDENGWTLIHFAAGEGQLEILKVLWKRGVDVNKKTYQGKTPHTIAYDKKNWDIVKWLQEHGAELVDVPEKIPLEPRNLKDGKAYERKLLLFVAASLSQNKEIDNFWLVSHQTGINRIDDVVGRVSFKDSRKKDIAVFVKSKLTATPDKVLWLKLNDNDKKQENQQTRNSYEIKLIEYEEAFNNVIEMMSSNEPETQELRKLLKGVDEKDYYVCIFTNAQNLYPELQRSQLDENHPIHFLNTQKCGQYRQFDHKNDTFNSNFYKQLYVLIGQANFEDIDISIAKLLGEEYKHKLENLDKVVKDFTQRSKFCWVLTKEAFKLNWFKVLAMDWMYVNLEQVKEINPKLESVWQKILANQKVINLLADKMWPLLAYYYQCVIIKEVDEHFEWQKGITLSTKNSINQKYSENVTDLRELLFLLWRERKLPLAIRPDCTVNILKLRDQFNIVEGGFVVFSSEELPDVITVVKQITDVEVLEEVMQLEVSLQGRPPVVLSDIGEWQIFSELKIAQVLAWTHNLEDGRQHIVGPLLRIPDKKYITRTFTRKQDNTQDQKQNKFSQYFPEISHSTYVNNGTRSASKQGTKDEEETYQSSNVKYVANSALKQYEDNGHVRKHQREILTVEDVVELAGPGLHIITGEPGLGKSTVLEQLAHKYSSKDFVIYIILRDCLDDIEYADIFPTIRADPIQYFFNKMAGKSDDVISRSIFQNHKTSKRLCLFLDGFDEMLPLHARIMSSSIAKILDDAAIPIFCTTRPSCEELISRRPNTIFLKLSPFGDEQIRQYLKKIKLEAWDIVKLFGDHFLSNPLHLNMISQIYEKAGNAKNITRGKMYKLCIELKHEIYHTKIGLSRNHARLQTNQSLVQHSKLALVDIFGRECVSSKGLITDTELDGILVDTYHCNIGIVDVSLPEGKFRFHHRTVAEYLVADWFLQMANQVISNKTFKYFYEEVMRKHINICSMINEVSRNFVIWAEASKQLHINSHLFKLDEFGRNVAHAATSHEEQEKLMKSVYKSRLFYRKDAVLQWTCREFFDMKPNENGSTVVYEINKDYPTRTPLDLSKCRRLLGQNNRSLSDRCTKLLTAIDSESKDDINSILTPQRSLLATGIGVVAFHSAITTGNKSIVTILLDLRPMLLNEQDDNDNTALHVACALGCRYIVELLLKRNADLDVVNKENWSPLEIAAAEGQLEIVSLLLDHIRERIDVDGHVSSEHYNKLLYRKTVTIACTNERWDVATWLIEHGADPILSDNNQWSAMHYAAEKGQIAILMLLLERGLNVNAKTSKRLTPLHIAMDNNHLETTKVLLKHDADPTLSNDNGWAAMHFASEKGQLEILRLLLEMGLNVNEKTNKGSTPLHIAIDNNHLETTKLLLKHGADPALSNDDGWISIHFAARRQLEIFRILLKMRPNVKAETRNGETPFTIAFKYKKWNIVNMLVLEHNSQRTTMYESEA